MAWSVGRATWVGELTDPEIAQQVGSRTFERGVACAAQRRVRSLAARPEGTMLLGTVEGSESETYQTIIEARPHPKGRSTLWSGRCSCPVGADCKHVVALLLLARDVALGKGPSDVAAAELPAPAAAPAGPVTAVHWADVLGHVKPRPREEGAPPTPEPRGDLMPAGLFVDTIYRNVGWQQGPGDRLRAEGHPLDPDRHVAPEPDLARRPAAVAVRDPLPPGARADHDSPA